MEMGFAGRQLHDDLAALHRWLVQPLASRLGPDGTTLVIVADGAIGNVPFAALVDSASASYLVERHPLRFAASLADATLPPAPIRDAGPLVLVGEPSLAPGTSEAGVALPPLRGAGDEVRAIAGVAGSRASLVAGAEATPVALRDAFSRAGVLHYAGHAVLDDAHAERSWLALARDSSGNARLTAEELATLDLSHLRLVVLSACQTLRARDGRSGGFAGFAEALLSAGAGGVVGSLWRVDDAATRELMVEFHRERATQGDVARALQAVQVRWLRSGDARRRAPAAWGAFRYAGR
jgi:CHAT domain-containing protein